MAFSFSNPFRRRSPEKAQPSPAPEASREDCEAVRRELDWRREIDEREIESELANVLSEAEIPPRALSEEEAWAESGGEWFSGFSSTYCVAIAYVADDEQLLMQFPDGSIYFYEPVNMPMAIELYRAPSKGTWSWSNLRERGTVFGHKVPYGLISGPSQSVLGVEVRRWMKSEESRRKHGNIPASGRDFHGNPIRPRDVR